MAADPLVTKLHQEIDKAIELRALVAETQGHRVACTRGCNACCFEPILVREPEAHVVAAFLEDHDEARRHFLEQLPAWRERVGDTQTVLAGLAGGAREAYETAHQTAWRRKAMCPLNRDGDCTVYAARPLVCRDGHVLDTSARCGPDGEPGPVNRLAFVPVERLLRQANETLAAEGTPLEPLPDAVVRLLGR
jgi:hypothetical protein